MTQEAAEAFAPAKINLSLHVTGLRADGYHLLDSLVAFANVGDTVRVRPASEMSLTVAGPMAEGVPTDHTNLVWKAAAWFGTPPVQIELTKRLPPASGIGGGTSDAAATLRALSQLYGKPLPSAEAAVQLGADLPICLYARPCRMRGIGESVEPLHQMPDLHLLLVNPGLEVPTPQVFKALATKSNPPIAMPDSPARSGAEWLRWVLDQRNDLEPAAIDQAPVIGDLLHVLRQSGAPLARMSGSGATCFVASHRLSDITQAEVLVAQHFPDFWCQRAKTWQIN